MKLKDFCFNPCFTGSTTSTREELDCKIEAFVCFNPCFTGSTTSTMNTLEEFEKEFCFNPCFTGSTTSTKVYLNNYPDEEMFQSLFYWKYHFNTDCTF